MRQKYDICSKWLIEFYGDAMIQLAGFGEGESFTPLAAEIVHARQKPDGLLDVRFVGREQPVLFLIDISTVPETRVDEQLIRDMMMVYINRGQLPEMLTLVLRPKGKSTVSSQLFRESPLGNTSFSMKWTVIDLWERSVTSSSEFGHAGMAPWMTLMKTDDPPEVHLMRCRDLAATASDPEHRDGLIVMTQIMSAIRYDEAVISRIFQKEFVMIESPLLDKWTEHRLLRERQKMILEVLRHRGLDVDEAHAATIRAIQDETRLGILTKAAATCQSMEQFRNVLDATL
jgi:hypothetical protein